LALIVFLAVVMNQYKSITENPWGVRIYSGALDQLPLFETNSAREVYRKHGELIKKLIQLIKSKGLSRRVLVVYTHKHTNHAEDDDNVTFVMRNYMLNTTLPKKLVEGNFIPYSFYVNEGNIFRYYSVDKVFVPGEIFYKFLVEAAELIHLSGGDNIIGIQYNISDYFYNQPVFNEIESGNYNIVFPGETDNTEAYDKDWVKTGWTDSVTAGCINCLNFKRGPVANSISNLEKNYVVTGRVTFTTLSDITEKDKGSVVINSVVIAKDQEEFKFEVKEDKKKD